jgi:hypothetical protein
MIRGHILLDGVTTNGLSPTPWAPFWEALALGAATKQYYPKPYELYIFCTGGTATVALQYGNTLGGLVTQISYNLTAGKAINAAVGRLQNRYLGLLVSGIAGATLNAYVTTP